MKEFSKIRFALAFILLTSPLLPSCKSKVNNGNEVVSTQFPITQVAPLPTPGATPEYMKQIVTLPDCADVPIYSACK